MGSLFFELKVEGIQRNHLTIVRSTGKIKKKSPDVVS